MKQLLYEDLINMKKQKVIIKTTYKFGLFSGFVLDERWIDIDIIRKKKVIVFKDDEGNIDFKMKNDNKRHWNCSKCGINIEIEVCSAEYY